MLPIYILYNPRLSELSAFEASKMSANHNTPFIHGWVSILTSHGSILGSVTFYVAHDVRERRRQNQPGQARGQTWVQELPRLDLTPGEVLWIYTSPPARYFGFIPRPPRGKSGILPRQLTRCLGFTLDNWSYHTGTTEGYLEHHYPE